MKVLASISLENEMDLMLAHQKTIKIAGLLGLSASTKTTFVTALSEAARIIIEYTDKGNFTLGLHKTDHRYLLFGKLVYEEIIPGTGPRENDFFYAKKLVPVFTIRSDGQYKSIEFSIGLPRSLDLNAVKIEQIANHIENEIPLSPYEALKNRHLMLERLTEMKEKQLQESYYLNNLKNEFISIVSHELKTPLTIIKANTQFALSPLITSIDAIQPFIRSVQNQCTKLSSLVEQLLDTAKMENGKLNYLMQEVDFNLYLEEIMQDLRHIVPDHSLNISPGASRQVKLDKLRIGQVFGNLIGNAAKYSEKGKPIEVATSVTDNGMLLIEVSDQGIGMTENTRKRVFEKFYRDDSVVHKYAGLGMGMYISFRIVQDHGGKIWADSIPDGGSSFYFTLPCC